MKVAILSDIHANLEALEATLADARGQGADRVVCLGDVVGYNTSPAECIALLQSVDALCIAGNHDRAVTRQIGTEEFSVAALRAVSWTRKRMTAEEIAWLANLPRKASLDGHMVLVHGALHVDDRCELVRLDSDDLRRLSFEALLRDPSGARVCAFGHTHHLGIYEYRNGSVQTHTEDEQFLREGSYYLVNPGSVGEPRTADRRATYLLFDTARQAIVARRVSYDHNIPLAKTLAARMEPRRLKGLPAPIRSALQRFLRKTGLYELVRRLINT
jgi:predicted phosphodiesterase